jgi:hypothetical protein
MLSFRSLLAMTAAIGLSMGSALAACPDTTAKTNAIAKDGTHAPMETPDKTAADNPVKKDGNTMPLAGQEGGGNKDLATSQQDVEAQQQGDKTAAAVADENMEKCAE